MGTYSLSLDNLDWKVFAVSKMYFLYVLATSLCVVSAKKDNFFPSYDASLGNGNANDIVSIYTENPISFLFQRLICRTGKY